MFRTARVARQWSVATLVLVCLSAESARAVVVSATNQSVAALAPAGNPGWDNVAYRGTASAVYLGNRWVITANHVGEGSLRFSDGTTVGLVAGSSVQLSNSGLGVSGAPDLRMFRLVEDPGLPTLEIDASRPAAGSTVMMIGAGRDRAPGLQGWNLTSGSTGFVWTPAVLPLAHTFGYSLSSTSTMRWGTNTVISGQIVVNSTLEFATRFDRPGDPFEAQAVVGDSGGGVFQFEDGTWKLAGIMTNQQPLSNQPTDTVVFGDESQFADLAAYRTQIVNLIARADPPWQNQANYFDVDKSGLVSPLDAMLVINELLRSGQHSLTGTPDAGSPLVDVSGDARVTNTDAMRIVNALKGGTANPTAASGSSALFVPEPSSGAIILAGLTTLALARCFARARPAWLRRRRARG